MIAEQIANLPHGGDRKSGNFKLTGVSLKQEEAAKQLGTTPKAITQARVIKEWAPEEAAKVANGTEALESAYKTANARKRETENKEQPEKSKPKATMLELEGIIDKKIVSVPYPEPKGKHQFNQTNDAELHCQFAFLSARRYSQGGMGSRSLQSPRCCSHASVSACR